MAEMTLIELLRSIVGEPVQNFSFSQLGLLLEYCFGAFLALVVLVLLFRALYNIINLFCLDRG